MYLLMHFCIQGNVPFMQLEGMHQLHILLFVLVIVHVIYSVMIMALGMWKVSMNIFSCSFIFKLFFWHELMWCNCEGFSMEGLGRKVLHGRGFRCTWHTLSLFSFCNEWWKLKNHELFYFNVHWIWRSGF